MYFVAYSEWVLPIIILKRLEAATSMWRLRDMLQDGKLQYR